MRRNKCQGSSKINKRTKRSEIQNEQLHSKTSEERRENTQKLANTKIHTYIQEPKEEERENLCFLSVPPDLFPKGCHWLLLACALLVPG